MNKLYLAFLLLGLISCISAKQDPVFLNETYYSDYVKLEDDRGSLWYWLFESRGSPKEDPLILYIPDGPGHTAAFSALAVNGPFKINQDNSTLSINPNSWNNIANVLYVDTPLGTGFSETDNLESMPLNQSGVADDIFTLLQQLVIQQPQFKGRDLYVAADGWVSHTLAWVCNKILDNSDSLDLKLKGWHAMNPYIYPAVQYPTWPEFAYQRKLINESTYDSLKEAFVPIAEWLSHLNDPDDLIEGDSDAHNYLSTDIVGNHSFNPLNIAQSCPYPDSGTVECYDFGAVEQFILQPNVLKALDIVNADVWAFFNFSAFNANTVPDYLDNSIPYYSKLVQSGLQGVVYVGENDLYRNEIGVERVVNDFEWDGQEKFKDLKYKTWGDRGEYKHLDNLTLMKVKDAGFFITIDQPTTSLLGLERLFNSSGW